jgi:hypothetical protein
MRNSKTSAPDDPSDHEHNRSFAINTNKSINRVKISLMHRFHLRTMRSRPSNPRHALPSWKTRRPKKESPEPSFCGTRDAYGSLVRTNSNPNETASSNTGKMMKKILKECLGDTHHFISSM